MDDIAKIALGVFIGALAAAFSWEGIQAVRLEIAIKKAETEMKKAIATETRRQDEQSRLQEEQRRQREQNANEAAQQQRERLRQIEQAKRDKESAFSRYFQPSETCKADPVQAECANAYMKAKTIFDSQYNPTN
jgi:uncharacterized membrane protein YccC